MSKFDLEGATVWVDVRGTIHITVDECSIQNCVFKFEDMAQLDKRPLICMHVNGNTCDSNSGTTSAVFLFPGTTVEQDD